MFHLLRRELRSKLRSILIIVDALNGTCQILESRGVTLTTPGVESHL